MASQSLKAEEDEFMKELESLIDTAIASGIESTELYTEPNELHMEVEDADTLQLMGRDENIGIGVFITCHGICVKNKFRRIPSILKVMKKNLTQCGINTAHPTRYKDETPQVIVERLTESFTNAFTFEECQLNDWPRKEGDVPRYKGEPVDFTKYTCDEFNTNPSNTTTQFVLKKYISANPEEGVLFSFGGITIDLMTVVSTEEIIHIFGINNLDPTHPNHKKINIVLKYIYQNIRIRNEYFARIKKNVISTDFIFNLSILLNYMYGVKIVRILDESCNSGISCQPIDETGRPIGYGGKKSKKHKKYKRRKTHIKIDYKRTNNTRLIQ